jgi:hypothetical protein
MPTLRSTLNALATDLALDIVDVIRSSSLEELLGERGSGPGRGPGRPPKSTSNGASKPSRTINSGRLPRRSVEEIAAALDEIVALVGKHKNGLRAEEIRKALELDVREVPRVLKEGLATKKLQAKGQKRATTYTAPA